jgi:hypothetical protein
MLIRVTEKGIIREGRLGWLGMRGGGSFNLNPI